jgi:DNA-binding transcriptional LysR family regulator
MRLWESIQPALQSIEQAVVQVHEACDEPRGVIKLNTSRMAARTLVEPHLDEFLTLYPKLTMELIMDDGLSNIVADGVDAGIRLGESVAEHMVAVPISSPLRYAVVGSPAYFARHKPPKTTEDLAQHNCVRYRLTSSTSLLHWSFTDPKDQHEFTVEPRGSCITNDDLSMLSAAVNGVGLVQHLDLAVQPYLDEGSLQRVLEKWCPPMAGFYLYIPTRDQMPRKTRALMDFLRSKR